MTTTPVSAQRFPTPATPAPADSSVGVFSPHAQSEEGPKHFKFPGSGSKSVAEAASRVFPAAPRVIEEGKIDGHGRPTALAVSKLPCPSPKGDLLGKLHALGKPVSENGVATPSAREGAISEGFAYYHGADEPHTGEVALPIPSEGLPRSSTNVGE